VDDYLELPAMEVLEWLARAARDCGHPPDVADALAYSAWWLENRGMHGVLRATTYLLLIHGRPYSELQPRMEDAAVVCLCPIACGVLLVARAEKDLSSFVQWVGGIRTADPVLMVPLIAEALDYAVDVHVRFYDQNLVFSQGGTTILSDSLATLHMIDARRGADTAVRLVPPGESDGMPTFPYEKKDRLRISSYRYVDGGGFRFD
jgi:hypothetical protein